MKETAIRIRAELAKLGYTSRDVSVRCSPSYQIRVEPKGDHIDLIAVRSATLRAYHAKDHHWLCVWCSSMLLPMPKNGGAVAMGDETMRILAIDSATKTGWAVLADGLIEESSVEDFTEWAEASRGALFVVFHDWLIRMIDVVSPTFVAYERPHHRGGNSTRLCLGLATLIQEECARRSIEYADVHSATLKKFATGDGRASKSDMVNAAMEFLTSAPQDDNEADAVHIARWAVAEFGDTARN